MSIVYELFAKAQELPVVDRAELARRLFQHLESTVFYREPGDEEAWAAELEERCRKYEAGETIAISADEFFEGLRQRLDEPRSS